MTPEQFYSESKWFDVRDKFERRSLIFNHYDLCEFANDYAQQELQAYRDMIKELLPATEWKLKSTESYLKDFGETIETEPEKFNECSHLEQLIDRAKQLIDTVTPI